ncbi:MAG: hypothetical protein WCP86_02065, partial [bacterium]
DVADAELRYPGYKNSPQVVFLGHKTYEIVLKFGTDRLEEITISTYNRGDAGDISASEFSTQVTAMDKAVSEWTAIEGKARDVEKLSANAAVNSKVWLQKHLATEMRWSMSKHAASAQDTKGFRAEYIKLVLTPRDLYNKRSSAVGTSGSGHSATALDSKRNVRRDADKYVFIDNIPMVDQGEKGYCAVATAERILRYYGKNVDQHMLAQMADTKSLGGTTPDAIFDVFRRIGIKLGVKISVHYDFSVRQLLNVVAKYNQEAKHNARVRPIDLGQGGVIDLARLYATMDLATLRRSRCEREQSSYKKFLVDIAGCVDQGIPVAWSVVLGLVPEKPELPQAVGGHLRIIFGYNKVTQEVVYTDSWGMGHERKTMSFADAWTITTGLFSLDPRH